MDKLDFKKEFEYLYKPSVKKFSMIAVPPLRCIMVDGQGGPETSSDFRGAMDTVQVLSLTLKSASRKILGRDYVVPPLEALWWTDDMTTFVRSLKENWKWTVMNMVPDWIDKIMIKETIETVNQVKPNPKLDDLKFETLREGKCVQILHIGIPEDKGPLLEKPHREYIPQHGLTFKGKHHEIYLSDSRKTPPEKLRTILRQPVGKIS